MASTSIGNITATLGLESQGFMRALKMAGAALSVFTVYKIGKESVRAFAQFEEAMRNVNTIAKENEQQFQATGQSVMELARQFGRTPTGLAQALYDINSASFLAAQGLEVLEASAIAARAGLSTTQEAARAITSALNAYGLAATEATDISDTMFQAVKYGVFTFGQFAGSLGIAVSTAAAAKVPFDELAAAIATMTRGGINIREAFTALNRVLLRIIQNKGLLGKVFATTAEGSGAAMLKVRKMAGTMEFLEKVTKGDTEAMIALGFMVRDLKAALSLTRNEGRDYAMDVERIATKNRRAGASAAAFAEQTKALSFEFDLLKSEVAVVAINIGSVLAPIVRLITKDVKNTTKAINDQKGAWTALRDAVQWAADAHQTWQDMMSIYWSEVWIELKFAGKAVALFTSGMVDNITNGIKRLVDKFKPFFLWLKEQWENVFKSREEIEREAAEAAARNRMIIVAASYPITTPEGAEPPPYRNLVREQEELRLQMEREMENLFQPYKYDMAPGRGFIQHIRKMREAFEGIYLDQQKAAASPLTLIRQGAATIEKGTVDAFRSERGLVDPGRKAAIETAANTKKANEILEKGIKIANLERVRID